MFNIVVWFTSVLVCFSLMEHLLINNRVRGFNHGKARCSLKVNGDVIKGKGSLFKEACGHKGDKEMGVKGEAQLGHDIADAHAEERIVKLEGVTASYIIMRRMRGGGKGEVVKNRCKLRARGNGSGLGSRGQVYEEVHMVVLMAR